MAEISSCQANYLFIGLIPGLGRGLKDFFLFFSFFLPFFLFFPFLDSYLLLLARPQQGKESGTFEYEERNLLCIFFLQVQKYQFIL